MLIGITTSHFKMPDAEDDLWRMKRYREAVEAAGAEVEWLWIPQGENYRQHAEEAAQHCDGLLVSGGADLPPQMYGAELLENANVGLIPTERPQWEIPLCEAFSQRDKPILGICYGIQLLNVWRGGTLIQDIPTQWPDHIEHSGVRHGVHLPAGSDLAKIIGADEFIVDSSHHQAIERVAPDATLIATAPDGICEAIEWREEKWMFGVQWHPERYPESLATQRLFEAFVQGSK